MPTSPIQIVGSGRLTGVQTITEHKTNEITKKSKSTMQESYGFVVVHQATYPAQPR